MRQWFRLDRPVVLSYLAITALGCGPAAPTLVPHAVAGVSRDQVQGWVRPTVPTNGALHRFKWLFRDERSSAGGRGSARIAAPDTLRFDVAGPLGSGKAAALVVGDSAIWVDSDKSIVDVVPNYMLMWAMFGVARLPDDGAALEGLEESERTSWLYLDGADTVAYLHVAGSAPKLVTEVRHQGKLVGRAETTLSAEGAPLKSRLTVPSGPARLDLTFYSSVPTATFPPDTWVPRKP